MYVFPVVTVTQSQQACPQGLTLPLTSCVTLGKALTLSGLCSPICEMGTLGRYLPPTFEDSLSLPTTLHVCPFLCLSHSVFMFIPVCDSLPTSLSVSCLSAFLILSFFTLSLCLWILPRTLGNSR